MFSVQGVLCESLRVSLQRQKKNVFEISVGLSVSRFVMYYELPNS
jgi:hypothetical protein